MHTDRQTAGQVPVANHASLDSGMAGTKSIPAQRNVLWHYGEISSTARTANKNSQDYFNKRAYYGLLAKKIHTAKRPSLPCNALGPLINASNKLIWFIGFLNSTSVLFPGGFSNLSVAS